MDGALGVDGRADFDRVWYGFTTSGTAGLGGATGCIESSTWRMVDAARVGRVERRTGTSGSSATSGTRSTAAVVLAVGVSCSSSAARFRGDDTDAERVRDEGEANVT